MDCRKTHFLDMVNGPDDIRVLSIEQLRLLAEEIRERIIHTVADNGGHLAPSLGVVELTIALHYVFESPKDRIVWDVGHQSYPHKLITGRNKDFDSLRKLNGISGFPKIKESEHDAFGTGHSSTSISAALGIAKARDLSGEDYRVIAVIGDGALTGGLAFEGLNNAGHLGTDMIVVLNDNEMSISPNVGALSNNLRTMVASPKYHEWRKKVHMHLRKLPKFGEKAAKAAMDIEDTARAFLGPGMLFKELGFKYYGPINGHRIEDLIKAFRNIKVIKGPVLLHVLTQKGKGYEFAEKQCTKFHGIGSFNIENGEKNKKSNGLSYTDVFGRKLAEIAEKNKKVVAITAAMPPGTGLEKFAKKYPERFFDVGIAEEHAVTFAAGIASKGFRPVCAIYSTFLQRAYDQIIHDVCLQNLNVIFAVDRAGLVGEDGPTHHGCFDLSYLRDIPNMAVMAPASTKELEKMLELAVKHNGPIAIRYPRGEGNNARKCAGIEFGKGELMKDGSKAAVIAVGKYAQIAYDIAKDIRGVAVINARFVKPLDKKLIIDYAKKTGKIITIEDNCVEGGFGSAVTELLQRNNVRARVKVLGLPDSFVQHGKVSELRKIVGLDDDSIREEIMEMAR